MLLSIDREHQRRGSKVLLQRFSVLKVLSFLFYARVRGSLQALQLMMSHTAHSSHYHDAKWKTYLTLMVSNVSRSIVQVPRLDLPSLLKLQSIVFCDYLQYMWRALVRASNLAHVNQA